MLFRDTLIRKKSVEQFQWDSFKRAKKRFLATKCKGWNPIDFHQNERNWKTFWMKFQVELEIQSNGECRRWPTVCLRNDKCFLLRCSSFWKSQHQMMKWNILSLFQWWWNVLSEQRSRTIAKHLFIHLLKLFNRTKNASLNKMYEGFFHFLYKSITKGRHFRSWCFVEFEHANVHFRSCWNEHHFIDFINVVEGVREPVWLYI